MLFTILVAVFYLGVSEGSMPAATKTKYESYLTRFDNQRGQILKPSFDANRRNVTLFMKSKFEAAGLTVYLQNFSSTETNTGQAVNGTNLIAVLPGSAYKTAKDEVVVLAAHLDTYGAFGGGVNNDGTGLVGLLAIAEDLTGPEKCQALNNSVVFVAFDRSETLDIGLNRTYCKKSCGSIEFLKHKATYIGNGEIKLAMVMDCISNFDKTAHVQDFTDPIKKYFKTEILASQWSGYWGDFLAISGKTNGSYLQEFEKFYDASKVDTGFSLLKFQWNIRGVPNAQNRSNLVNAFKDGDHVSFWDANVNAILLTDTCYNRGYMRGDCYKHDYCDKMNKLDESSYEFMYSAVNTAMKLTMKLTCTDPCAKCDPAADCKNDVCSCKTGYTGNGYTCTDIDECAAKPCSTSGNCTNQPGSFSCYCERGFTGNGYNCTVISESSLVLPHQLLISSSVFLSLVVILTNAFSYKSTR